MHLKDFVRAQKDIKLAIDCKVENEELKEDYEWIFPNIQVIIDEVKTITEKNEK